MSKKLSYGDIQKKNYSWIVQRDLKHAKPTDALVLKNCIYGLDNPPSPLLQQIPCSWHHSLDNHDNPLLWHSWHSNSATSPPAPSPHVMFILLFYNVTSPSLMSSNDIAILWCIVSWRLPPWCPPPQHPPKQHCHSIAWYLPPVSANDIHPCDIVN